MEAGGGGGSRGGHRAGGAARRAWLWCWSAAGPDSKIYVRRKEEACEKARRPRVRASAHDLQATCAGLEGGFKPAMGGIVATAIMLGG